MSKIKEKEKMYRITLTETQLRVIQNICELRFRIDLLQGHELTEVLSQINTDLSPDNPNHNRIFDLYIERRNAIGEIIDAIFRIVVPYRNMERKRDRTSLICEDIYQAIRYRLYLDNPNRDQYGYSVESRPPFQVSDLPLPIIEINE